MAAIPEDERMDMPDDPGYLNATEDWAKGRSWDLWTPTDPPLPVSSLPQLQGVLGLDPTDVAGLAHFMELPAAQAMPVHLRNEIEAFLHNATA